LTTGSWGPIKLNGEDELPRTYNLRPLRLTIPRKRVQLAYTEALQLLPTLPHCLLPGAGREDQRHTARRPFPRKLERMEIGDLGGAPVAAAGEHIVAEVEVDERAKVALRRNVAVGPQLGANPLEVLLGVAVQQRVSALVRVLLLVALRVAPLQRLQVLPHVVLPGRRVTVHPEALLRTVQPRDRRHVAAHRAPRQLGLILRHASIDLPAPLPERSADDAVHDEEEELVLRDSVAVVVLLLRAELLDSMLRLCNLV